MESKSRVDANKASMEADVALAAKHRSDVMLDWQRWIQSLGIPDLWIKVRGDDGRVYEVLNPALADSFNEGAGVMSMQKYLRDRPPRKRQPIGKKFGRGYGPARQRTLPDIILR